jgi:diacylglycerol kinase family enzyme
MSQKLILLINPYCHQGRGWKKWLAIKSGVSRFLPNATEIVTEKGTDLAVQLQPHLNNNERTCIVSAGGDGSIHYLVNNVMQTKNIQREKLTIGAIGIGSSNDFLKPFRTFINRIPVRINIDQPARWHDLGKVIRTDTNNNTQQKFFIVNASFGATAHGNWNFNNPGTVLRWLKKQNTSMAITYAAISTILTFKNDDCNICYNGKVNRIAVSNINLLKIPFVSGSLHYNQDILPDDGYFGLNICSGMNRAELLQTLFSLENGKFEQDRKKTSLFVDRFQLESATPVVFECDGETEKVTAVDISIAPKAIQVLAN